MKINSTLAFFFAWIPAVVAQQNFFNVPSSEITKPQKILYQGQLNLTAQEVESNTTFSYGVGKNLEVGINLFGLTFDPTHHFHFEHNDTLSKAPLYPLIIINIQKGFEVFSQLTLSLGTQNGLNPDRHTHWVNYTYANLAYEIPNIETRLVAGAYSFNKAFEGDWNGQEQTTSDNYFRIGFHAGIQHPLLKNKLLLVADFISHRHKMGESAWGIAYHITQSWVASIGYQLPNPGSLSTQGVIFEITHVPE